MDAVSQGNEDLEPPVAGAPPAAARPRVRLRGLGVPIAVFVCMAAIVMVAGYLVYRHQAAAVRTQQGLQLAAIRDLKAADISRWFADAQTSAKAASENPVHSSAVRRWTSEGGAPPAPFVVRALVDTTRAEQGYDRVLLLDLGLRAIYATPREGPAPDARARALGARAMERREVVFSDLYLDEPGNLKMEFLAPLTGGATASSRPAAVLALELDPEASLFPLVDGWPTTSKSGETLLVERRGDTVVFLNTTRRRKAAALRLAFPITRTQVPAVKAVRGEVGVVTGVDYSGTVVMAAVGPVPGTPWFLVSKVDISEIDAPLRSLMQWTVFVVLGIILLGGAVMLVFWSRWRSRDLQRLYEAELELSVSERRFTSAFEHAPVGVSLTRPDGTVGKANATLAEMLGYSVAELEGLTVTEFTHPDDRVETATLVAAALAGDIDHFKTDKRYLRKDGSAVWAAASVTLLRDALGRPDHFVAMTSDISARMAAEEALTASEARYRGLFENALIGFALHEIVLDGSGAPVDYVFLEANSAFGEYTGLVPAEIAGRRVTEVIPGIEASGLIERYGEVALGGEPQRFETFFEPFGRHYDIHLFSPQRGQFATAFLDVTERVRAQQTLSAFFDNHGVGLGILDRDLRYVRVNETLADIDRVSMSDHLGRTVQDVLGGGAATCMPALLSVLCGEEEVSLEVSGGTTSEPDVEHHWLASYFPVAGTGGPVEAIGLVAVDVTGRRDAERDLAESRRFLQRVLDVTPDLIYIYDLSAQRNVFANREMVDLLAYTPKDILEMGSDVLPRLLHPDDAPLVAEHHRKAALLADGETLEMEYRMRRGDGAWCWLRSRDSVFRRGADEVVTQLIGTAQDITEQRAAEEEVRRERDFSTAVQRVAGALIIVLDPAGRIVAFNQACEAAAGFSEAEMLGTPLWDRVIPPDQLEGVRATFERLSAGQFPVSYENDWLTKGGGRRTIQWKNSAVLDGDGSVDYVIGTGIDVTELRRAEGARRQAERELAEMNVELERRVLERTFELEAANTELEAFSYSASHDLRAPLRALDGFSLALLEDYGGQLDDTGKDYLARVRAASQRMAQLIDDLLMLSQVSRREMVREKVDLSALARDVLAGLREADPERAVDAQVADGLVTNGDPALLRIVLQNLLANAWKFTSRMPEAHVEVGVDRRDGVEAYFVRDDGAGFDATYVDKLFTPFQRLHAADEFPGTGIGLATVKRIVRRHGGAVWAEGYVQSGATFHFTLR